MKPVSKKELELLSHKDIVRFALFCAEQVKEGWKGIPECVVAIETVERWLKGKAAAEECVNAADAAASAANAAYTASATAFADAYAYYATYTAAIAAYSASHAARATYAAVHAANAAYAASHAAAGKSHLIDAQWNYYLELLHFDDIAEKALLGGVV